MYDFAKQSKYKNTPLILKLYKGPPDRKKLCFFQGPKDPRKLKKLLL
jgi:hypothetical protein